MDFRYLTLVGTAVLVSACGGSEDTSGYVMPSTGSGFEVEGFADRQAYFSDQYDRVRVDSYTTYDALPGGSATYTGQSSIIVRDSPGGTMIDNILADTALTVDFDSDEINGAMVDFVASDGAREGRVEIAGTQRVYDDPTRDARYRVGMSGEIESGGAVRQFEGLISGGIAGPAAEGARFVISAADSELRDADGTYYGTVNGSVFLER